MQPTKPSAKPLVPRTPSLRAMTEAVQDCRGCELYKRATQAVFGEGPSKAEVMFVGEQPGDQEDKAGHPFVGPAGRTLDKAMAEAGIDRSKAYVTNAVKHFKFEERGKRRIHKKPLDSEVTACRPWLEAEIEIVKPRLLVALGATAAAALGGKAVKLTQQRGQFLAHPKAEALMLTIHPSYLFRLRDPEGKRLEYERFVKDLSGIGAYLKGTSGK